MASTASGNMRTKKKELVQVLAVGTDFHRFESYPQMLFPALPSNQDCSEYNIVQSFIHILIISFLG